MEGKKIKVYFDDGQKIAWRIGVLTSKDEFSIELDYKEVISKGRIVRMEVLENDKTK